jgi:hypothetical protein
MERRFAGRATLVAALLAAALSTAALPGETGSVLTRMPIKGSVKVEPLRSRDPDGGAPWVVRSFQPQGSGLTCAQVGRLVHGKVGTLDDHHHFVALPFQALDCTGPRDHPATWGFTTVQTNAPAGGCKAPPAPPPPGVKVTPLPPDPRPVCDPKVWRIVISGYFGSDLTRVTIRQPHHKNRHTLRIGPRGDFLYVERGMGMTAANDPIVSLTFNSGCSKLGKQRLRIYGARRIGHCRIVLPDIFGRIQPPDFIGGPISSPPTTH